MMELQVDYEKKKQYQKCITKSKRPFRIMNYIIKALCLMGTVGAAAYAIINMMVPSLNLVNAGGTMVKDTSLIAIVTIVIASESLFIALLLHTVVRCLGGRNCYMRMDEGMMVDDEAVRYVYRDRYASAPNERKVLTFEFSKIQGIQFDDNTKFLVISGEILYEHYGDYRCQIPGNVSVLNEFEICDYFSPSLKDMFLEKGISIKMKG